MHKHARSYDTFSYLFVHLRLDSQFKMFAIYFDFFSQEKKKTNLRKGLLQKDKNFRFC